MKTHFNQNEPNANCTLQLGDSHVYLIILELNYSRKYTNLSQTAGLIHLLLEKPQQCMKRTEDL